MTGVKRQRLIVVKSLALISCALLFTLCSPAEAQQPKKVPWIGFLTGSSLSSQAARNEAFRRSLRELGYVEGKNIVIEWRSYEGKLDRQHAYIDELVRLNVDVIVAQGGKSTEFEKVTCSK